MTINRVSTKDLPTIVAGLVREGIAFEVKPHAHYGDEWQIVITGY